MKKYGTDAYQLPDAYQVTDTSPQRGFHSRAASLATPQSRIAAFFIDLTLFGVTFGVGWLIWFFIIAERGTTPGHDLMGQVVVNGKTGEPLSLGKMVLRELLLKGLLASILGSMTMFINYLIDGGFMFRADRRALHDYLVGSEVMQMRSSTILEKLQRL